MLLRHSAVGGGAGAVYVEDVFSTSLYTGNSTVNQINNGLALGSNAATSGGGEITPNCNIFCSQTAPSMFGTGDFTVECFFYATTFNASFGQVLVQNYFGPADADNAWGLRLDTTGNVVTSTWNTVLSTGASSVSLNAWHHVAWSRSGSSNAVWLDGTRINTFTNAFDYNRSNNCRFSGGTSGGVGDNFTGAMSNVRLVKGSAVYNPSSSTITVPTSALTAIANTSLLIFQGSAPLVDNSGNGYGITYTTGGGYVAPQATDFGPFAAAPVTAKGGMVWCKTRSNATSHGLYDTVRGVDRIIKADATNIQSGGSAGMGLSSFNTNGFTLDSDSIFGSTNFSGYTYVAWAFAKQRKFFDVVTYTGDGNVNKHVPHSLGSVPGFIIVKSTSAPGNWGVWHRGDGTTFWTGLSLNTTGGGSGATNTHTSTTFNAGPISDSTGTTIFNDIGATYVAYLFAHNAGGFGANGTDNVISCGTFTTDGTSTFSVNLGYEPQFVMVKPVSTTGPWYMVDSMRGFVMGGVDKVVWASANFAESATGVAYPTATGFAGTGQLNVSQTFIYLAVRRGPMKTPTLGTSVFSAATRTGTGATFTSTAPGFALDMLFNSARDAGASFGGNIGWNTSRLQGGNAMRTQSTINESGSYVDFGNNATGFQMPGTSNIMNFGSEPIVEWYFKRAPGFFDVVCYSGSNVNATINHNLGVVPEMMIVKGRNFADDWAVYHSAIGNTGSLRLNTTGTLIVQNTVWNNTTPTASVFSLGTNSMVNTASQTYVAYLFASCPGVSKVGTYTGTGAAQTINCGFTSGARFVLIKRTDTTGDWYVWDSARGMVSGTDWNLMINTNTAEANANYVFTSSTGFTIQAAAPAGINASGGTYIYLAIA